jgi:hypothetical protein
MAFGDDPENPDWDPIAKQWREGYIDELTEALRACNQAMTGLSNAARDSALKGGENEQ